MSRLKAIRASLIAAMLTSCVMAGDPPASGKGDDTGDGGRGSGQAAAHPRAVVCLSIDQFRWDYFPRFKQYLGEDGLRRIEREGQLTLECRYEYANTVTAAGHATMMTGFNPSDHGILGNGWWDRKTGKSVHNSADPDTKVVSTTGKTEKSGYSPFRRRKPAVGDDLIAATKGDAKVLSVAFKDRSAILMGPSTGKDVYWFDSQLDQFVTSTHYRESLPDWLIKFQEAKPADRWLGKTWMYKLQPEEYEKHCTVDDFVGESQGKLPKTFPKKYDSEPGVNYYDQVETSPAGDELTLDLAITAMKAMEIGQDDIPDLVSISFSAFDKAGHQYGPDSWEMMDFFIREDEQVARLLKFLDGHVGEGKYVLLITADHGVAPLPEHLVAKGLKAGRIDEKKLERGADAAALEKFGAHHDRYVVGFNNPYLVLDPMVTENPTQQELADFIDEWARNLVGVQDSWTRAELEAATPAEPLKYAARLSMTDDGGGDVYLLSEPNYFFSFYPAGTTHSTPHEYDARVPMFAYGSGFGKFAGETRSDNSLPEAKSPRWMAEAARRALGLPQPSAE